MSLGHYIVWVITPLYPSPPPHSLPHPPSLPGRICSALISNFVGEKTKAIIRETKAFLIIEVRVIIHRDS
jgi:hypothetical protein